MSSPACWQTAAGLPDGVTVTAVSATTVGISQATNGPLSAGSSVVFSAPTLGSIVNQPANLSATCWQAVQSRNTAATDRHRERVPRISGLGREPGRIWPRCTTPRPTRLLGWRGARTNPAPRPGRPATTPPGCSRRYRSSTPGTPAAANAAVEPAVFNNLKSDFTTCRLPYSQALDVSRTYLGHFRTCRFEEMRPSASASPNSYSIPRPSPRASSRISGAIRSASTSRSTISASRPRNTRRCSRVRPRRASPHPQTRNPVPCRPVLRRSVLRICPPRMCRAKQPGWTCRAF